MSKDKVTINCKDCGDEFDTYSLQNVGIGGVISDSCPKCRQKKREEMEEHEQQRIEVEATERKQSWRVVSGIPRRFRSENFNTFEVGEANGKKIHALCLDYAENFPLAKDAGYKSLGMFSKGIWGNGKSHLACSIAHKIIDRWIGGGEQSPVLYITEPQMFSRIRATFNRGYDSNGETEDSVYHHLTTVPLLIVDDIGKEEVPDPRFVQRVWFSVVNGRYDNMLPVVITANLDPDGIEQHLGGSRGNEATFDRLYEMLGGVFWEMTGSSYRRLKHDMPDR